MDSDLLLQAVAVDAKNSFDIEVGEVVTVGKRLGTVVGRSVHKDSNGDALYQIQFNSKWVFAYSRKLIVRKGEVKSWHNWLSDNMFGCFYTGGSVLF